MFAKHSQAKSSVIPQSHIKMTRFKIKISQHYRSRLK